MIVLSFFFWGGRRCRMTNKHWYPPREADPGMLFLKNTSLNILLLIIYYIYAFMFYSCSKVVTRMKQYKEDLLAACLVFTLSLPQEIALPLLSSVIPAMQVYDLYDILFHVP